METIIKNNEYRIDFNGSKSSKMLLSGCVVFHKTTGERLVVKKNYGSVLVCYCEPSLLYGNVEVDICICHIDSLTNNQNERYDRYRESIV
jgi:hypothetical protein